MNLWCLPPSYSDFSAVTSLYQDFLHDDGNCDQITSICCDISLAYIKGITENFPDSSIIYNKSHVMKIINLAVDEVRRNEQAYHKSLNKTRYFWLKNFENLSGKQKKPNGPLLDMNLETARAYNIKFSFQSVWIIPQNGRADTYLKKMVFLGFAQQIKANDFGSEDGQSSLERYFQLIRISNL